MIHKIIAFSVSNKLIVGVGLLAIIIVGIWAMGKLPVDAVPDITNNQVQVVTISPSMAPEEVERLITRPVEFAMANLPEVDEIRSISRFGLSVVTIVFDESVPPLDARQYVREQLDIARSEIPEVYGIPELMPITTGLGEIYQYTLEVEEGYEDKYDAQELRTIQDWIVKRRLSGIPGIVEVSSFGGFLKQYEVSFDPNKLSAAGLGVDDLREAVEGNNKNTGGGVIEKNGQSWYIRSEGLLQSQEEIENIVVSNGSGGMFRIGDLAEVRLGHAPRFGAMTRDGKGEAVGGITLMLKGANSSEAIQNVHDRVEQISKSLPEGVILSPYLDRSELVGRAMHTVSKNLIEGGLIVIFVLVLLLGNFRAGLIVASVIPLSLLFAFILMHAFGVSANLMSLGAIDFGIVVDGAVIVVEGVLHALHKRRSDKELSEEQMNGLVISSASSIYKSAAFGVLIILVVFVPVMTLEGIEGKMFRPMAQTVSFAILGAMLLSITYVPMAAALFLSKKAGHGSSLADRLMNFLQSMYRPTLLAAIGKPVMVVVSGLALLIVSAWLFGRMGAEFIPTLEEGDLAMQMTLPPGSGLTESISASTKAEQILLNQFPEVKHVVSKIGTAEVPTDPMAVEDADIMIVLKPPSDWVSASGRDELVTKMKHALSAMTGVSFEFTQPIQLRFNELMTGAKTDIAVRISGDDLEVLADLGTRAQSIIQTIQGAGDVRLERTEGLPQVLIRIDRRAAAFHGIHADEIQQVIATSFAGADAGVFREGERQFDIVVRLPAERRPELDLSALKVKSPVHGLIPLNTVAYVSYEDGPIQISRYATTRGVTVGVNVRGRDIESLVNDIRASLDSALPLPPGYAIHYGGQFENLEQARSRLLVAVPMALMLIVFLLYLAFGTVRHALLISSAVPLSAIGGVLALWLRDMPFSISAGVGFIALFGVAVLNGIVLLSALNRLQEEGVQDIRQRILLACEERLRPVIMTAAVAALGFLPMALSTSAGAEVQKPLATVVIGGLVSSTLLTLVLLPALYLLIERRRQRRRMKSALVGVSLIFLWPALAQAQEYSEAQAIEDAMQNNPALLRSERSVELARLQKRQAWNFGDLNTDLQYGQINASDQDYMLTFIQDIRNPLALARVARLGEAEEDYARLDHANNVLLLRAQVRQAWWKWVISGHILQRTDSVFHFMEKASKAVEERYEKGVADAWTLNMIRSKKERVRSELLLAERTFMQAGFDLEALTLNAEPKELPAFDQLGKAAGEFPLQRSARFRSLLEADSLRSEAYASMMSAEQLPNLRLGYFSQQLEGVPGFNGVFAGVSFPIGLWFSGVSKKHTIHREIAESERKASRFSLQQHYERTLRIWQKRSDELTSVGLEMKQSAARIKASSTERWSAGTIDFETHSLSMEEAFRLELAYLEMLHQAMEAAITLQYLSE